MNNAQPVTPSKQFDKRAMLFRIEMVRLTAQCLSQGIPVSLLRQRTGR